MDPEIEFEQYGEIEGALMHLEQSEAIILDNMCGVDALFEDVLDLSDILDWPVGVDETRLYYHAHEQTNLFCADFASKRGCYDDPYSEMPIEILNDLNAWALTIISDLRYTTTELQHNIHWLERSLEKRSDRALQELSELGPEPEPPSRDCLAQPEIPDDPATPGEPAF